MKEWRRIVGVILAAAMVLSGCGPSGGEDTPSEVTEPILSAEATGELNLYLLEGSYNNLLRDDVAKKFQEKYPDVTLNIEVMNWKELDTRLQNELISGGGPDLIFTNYLSDVYKSMKSGIFADLNPLLERDPTFRMSEFYENVMDAGTYAGKRYLLPLSFGIPVFCSTEKNMEQTGFTEETYKDCSGFIKSINTYIKNNDPLLFDDFAWNNIMVQYWCYSGVSLGNHETGEITIDEQQLRELMELSKPLYRIEDAFPLRQNYNIYDDLKDSKFLIYDGGNSPNQTLNIVGYLNNDELDPVLFPLRTVDGGIKANVYEAVGIRGNSPNQDNAYRFISLLLNSDYQRDIYALGGIPVRRESELVKQIGYQIGYHGNFGKSAISNISELNEYSIQFNDYIAGITDCSITANDALIQNLYAYFEPYLKDEKSFESCLDEYKQYLTLYLSE